MTTNILPIDIYIQYQNASNFANLLRGITDYLTIPITEFYSDFFDLRTCTTQGIDNWGRILNQSRVIQYFDFTDIFGFDLGLPPPEPHEYPQNYNHGNFFSFGGSSTSLDDTAYRALLQFTYFNQTIDCSVGACVSVVNYYVRQSNPNNKCVLTESNMSFNYAFNYQLQGWEIVLFTYTKILPTPAGIPYTVTWIN